MAGFPSRYLRICALLAVGFIFSHTTLRAATLSEDGGAGVFRLQSAALPEENQFGVGLYNRFINFGGGDAFNSLLKGNSVTDATDNKLYPADLFALNHVLAGSFSTMEIFEAHLAIPMYTQNLSYDSGKVNSFRIGDIRYGLKLALPLDLKRFPLSMALIFGGSFPTTGTGAPVPVRLEYFPANPGDTSSSHPTGTKRDDWHIGAAATLDLERLPTTNYTIPWQIHFNAGARKTSALMTRDRDYYDIFSAGVGFEGRIWKSVSLVGEYWHENILDTTTAHGRIDDISLGVVFHTANDLSILVGGSMALANGESTPFNYYNSNGHQYDARVRSSSHAQLILAVTYTHRSKPRDTDGDGIGDKLDKCPLEAQGLRGRDGCPARDRDGDGLLDSLDKCPNEPQGALGFQGCPLRDRDGDGVLDSADKCPDEPEGLNGKEGCPNKDSDGDGIPDDLDKCPRQPETFNGHMDEDGCPDMPTQSPQPASKPAKMDVQQKTLVLTGVSFETGKAVLLPESYPSLDDITAQLTSLPEIELEISGHTDNRGSAELNAKLSKARAQAVADYLIQKGVAAGRFRVAGYGFNKPLVSNKTAEGRAQNRRVEFKRLK